MIVDDATALVEFTRIARPAECVALTTDEINEILAKFKRASLWTAATVFQLGDVVIPSLANRNGRRYRAQSYRTTGTDQKTGAAEPTWSTSRDALISDGNIIWQEDGWDWDADLWDITAAAAEGWRVKAGKASVTSDTQVGDLKISSSQLYDHCLEMAKQFQRNYVV